MGSPRKAIYKISCSHRVFVCVCPLFVSFANYNGIRSWGGKTDEYRFNNQRPFIFRQLDFCMSNKHGEIGSFETQHAFQVKNALLPAPDEKRL